MDSKEKIVRRTLRVFLWSNEALYKQTILWLNPMLDSELQFPSKQQNIEVTKTKDLYNPPFSKQLVLIIWYSHLQGFLVWIIVVMSNVISYYKQGWARARGKEMFAWRVKTHTHTHTHKHSFTHTQTTKQLWWSM